MGGALLRTCGIGHGLVGPGREASPQYPLNHHVLWAREIESELRSTALVGEVDRILAGAREAIDEKSARAEGAHAPT